MLAINTRPPTVIKNLIGGYPVGKACIQYEMHRPIPFIKIERYISFRAGSCPWYWVVLWVAIRLSLGMRGWGILQKNINTHRAKLDVHISARKGSAKMSVRRSGSNLPLHKERSQGSVLIYCQQHCRMCTSRTKIAGGSVDHSTFHRHQH